MVGPLAPDLDQAVIDLAFVLLGVLVRDGVQSIAILVTMASRVVLHEHYLTDVLGAILGVAGIGLFGIALALRHRPPVSVR